MFVPTIFSAESSGPDTGDIGHSVRQRRAASASWSRTPANNNSRTVWTYSEWIKRGELGTDQLLLDAGTDGNNESAIWLTSANKLYIYNYVAAAYGCRRVTTLVLRDPTAFFHLVVASNGTTSFKIWINGVEITAFDTTSGTNSTNWFFNHSSYAMHMGKRFNNTNYFDGCRARGCFIGGSALTAADFGYFNTEINEWVTKSQSAIKALVDAGDSNSSMLDFDDPNFATYGIGKDFSSKGNHWTPTNISLTAGSTYDYMLDVPGNSYATWNPLFPTTNTISNGNLRGALAASVNAGYGIRSTIPMVSGKYEAEFVPAASADSWSYVGVCPASLGISDVSIVGSNAVLYRAGNGNKNVSGSATAYGASWTTEAIRVAVDMDARTVTFYKAGASQGSISLPSGTENYIFVMANGNATTFTADANFGQQPITLDSGHKALCQRNMPDPAILNPELHHNVVLATGANIKTNTEALFPGNFLEWIKDRANANNHQLIDTVRGSSAVLQSNTTAAETTYAAPSGNSVGWLWKAGGAAVTNNAGSISSQVSANVTAGFSIVTYTGTGANATVGHGLASAPELVIVKKRTPFVSPDWVIWHSALAATEYLLFTTAAKGTATTVWNSTKPTSSVISVGTDSSVNQSTSSLVTYCFHSVPGYSKIGSYVGNGSADGPYVDCGFKPKYVLYKRTDSTGAWGVLDAARNPTNAVNWRLYPSSNAAEETNSYMDFTATGFKIRVDSAEPTINASGGTYIFYAVADVPGKYSLAR